MQHHDLSPQPADLHYTCNLLKALADETRLQLVLHLLEQEWSVSGLVSRLSLPQSTVSRHLGVLRHAGIVATRRDGTSVYYRLADAHLGDLVRQAFAHAEHKRLGLPDHGSTAHPGREGGAQ
jgi:DNA-binding transcriptional ArsR family regulator